MAANFMRILFGRRAAQMQDADGSRAAYARLVERRDDDIDRLTPREIAFIAARDSFYMATVTQDLWPYVQHRGGPAGFLRHLGGNRLGFADYGGNRQFISAANIADTQRAALFLMDYPGRRRLKLIGEAAWEQADAAHPLWQALVDEDYPAAAERFFLLDVLGFDWNCPQHIVPRYTRAEYDQLT